MRVLCVFSKYNYGDPARGEGYEYTNFIPALHRLGHEVTLFENWDRREYHNFAELNHQFLLTVERIQPDVIFAVQNYYEIWLETWQILRDAGMAATVNWATDDSWKYEQFSRFLAPVFHAYATTYLDVYEQYCRDGHTNVLLTQWAANAAALQPPLPAMECQYPVSFIGTAHGERPARIESLRRRGIEVMCFGYGWPSGAVSAIDVPRIIQHSVISLNFSRGAWVWKKGRFQNSNQLKARTFEVPGAGGFLLTEWAKDLERYYQSGREIAVFHDDDDLAAQIRYYLAHLTERDQIAHAGYERTSAEHTYETRLAEVLSFARIKRDRFFLETGKRPAGKIAWDVFNRAVEHHTMSPELRAIRRGLIALCTAIWNTKRGPRAARRIVFELSWRLLGARTYSSVGLPGRLFYWES